LALILKTSSCFGSSALILKTSACFSYLTLIFNISSYFVYFALIIDNFVPNGLRSKNSIMTKPGALMRGHCILLVLCNSSTWFSLPCGINIQGEEQYDDKIELHEKLD